MSKEANLKEEKKVLHNYINIMIAHFIMLGDSGLLSKEEAGKIVGELQCVLFDIVNDRIKIDGISDEREFINEKLKIRLGELGEKINIARYKNDEEMTVLRLNVKDKIKELSISILRLMDKLINLASENERAIFIEYINGREEVVTIPHQLMAYTLMFFRDYLRLNDGKARLNLSPLGSGNLSGVSFPINRHLTCKLLDFDIPTLNSIDSILDRDFYFELSNAILICLSHLSKLICEIEFFSIKPYLFIKNFEEDNLTSEKIKKNIDRAILNLKENFEKVEGKPLLYNEELSSLKGLFENFNNTINFTLEMTNILACIKINEDKMLNCVKAKFNDFDFEKDILDKISFGGEGETKNRIVMFRNFIDEKLKQLEAEKYFSLKEALLNEKEQDEKKKI